VLETLDVSGSYVTGNFMLGSDHHGGTDITFTTAAARAPLGQGFVEDPHMQGPLFTWGVVPHIA
jgi:hypothetical protein